jgi:hypothetical protein
VDGLEERDLWEDWSLDSVWNVFHYLNWVRLWHMDWDIDALDDFNWVRLWPVRGNQTIKTNV